MKTKNLNSLITLLAIVATALVTGCATPVTVTSDPPGALVYSRGSGRSSYRWRNRGQTPTTFKVPYNAIQTFVQWPGKEGTRSELSYDKLLFTGPKELHFVKPSN